MRPYQRAASLFLAVASLLYFGSCERHKPEELAHGEHAEAGQEHSAQEAHDHAAGGSERETPQSTASPAATPAQFFPSPTPTP